VTGVIDILGRRELNRATLARQFLLQRSTVPPLDAVEHLVGLQAQVPQNPYVALWSRLERFDPEILSGLLVDRKVVRTVVMRATIHLVTADDCLVLRPLCQPVLDGELARHRDHAPKLVGIDLAPVLAFAAERLAARPLTVAQLRGALAERFPDEDPAALAMACRNRLALVQVPPRGLWGRGAQVTVTTAESWLGALLAADPSLDDVVLRYFGAFGPATVADVATWSRLTALREVVERLRPRLRTFRDESGRELFDLPEAPRPDPDCPAEPRFLPEYDNVLLSHADRSRFLTLEEREQLAATTGPVHGTVLYDGRVVATWRTEKQRTGAVVLVVTHAGRLGEPAVGSIAGEGQRLLRFLTGASSHDLRFVALS
jgi:hypothetical protein